MRFRALCVIAWIWVGTVHVSTAADGADDAFFESKVRPLLIAKCLECHGAEKPKAGLRLDSREAMLTGGDSGPLFVVGKPEESLLMDVIGHRNGIQMPPKSKLPEVEIAILTEWVKRGAPWPNSMPTTPTVSTPAAPADFTAEQKSFWAFQPIQSQSPRAVNNEQWIRSPIDRFILAELEAKGLQSAGEADRRTLIRRVTLNLTGLPPTPEEVDEFVNDSAADALERLVDRLIASPRYGERWARRWLDIARYADSNGLDENLAYANAYRYRDYVVRSMREDKPYDQFLQEQIAGDLLAPIGEQPDGTPSTAADAFDPLIATGFLSLGAKMLAEDDPVKMQMDIIDEQVDTISRAVMGLTMGCARCHDHKYDPLATADYYGLAGVFKSTKTMDTFTVVARWHERPLATAEQVRYRDGKQQLADAAKQAFDQAKTNATEAVLSEARQNAVAYLLAATREFRMADMLAAAMPRGNMPNPRELPGAILIEAEDFTRGNVLKDRDRYGVGIGVLVNRGETPNFTEYDFSVDAPGFYQLELRYTAAASRPVRLFVNRSLVKANAADRVTGTWNPDSQKWFVESFVKLQAGQNIIRLEQPQFFPHIDKLLLTRADSTAAEMMESIPLHLDDNSGSDRLLHPSILQQWIKQLRKSRDDQDSILTAWNQYLREGRLTVLVSLPGNGVERLLSGDQPDSWEDLAQRYERLFSAAIKAWDAVKALPKDQQPVVLEDSVLDAGRKLLYGEQGPLKAPSDIESLFSMEVISQLGSLREQQSKRDADVPKFNDTMAVADSQPQNLKIHLRGSHLTLGKEVVRRLPRILTPQSDVELTNGSGRLQLARWLTKADHPLTSRVIVNRLWQWHFGHGLVRSPDNFGKLGERPSHPELLDWLAREFTRSEVANDDSGKAWSWKALHRQLISSAVYRQKTDANAEATLIDPENRLLWRFHRQRMDAEVLRDSLLFVGNKLDETPGGTLLPTRNREYVTSTASVNPEIYNSPRRSIYLPVVRSALYEVFTAFDFADPSTLAGQRDQTTVAPQALFMMNSRLVLEQVRGLAERLLAKTDVDTRGRIRYLYELSYSRLPTEAESAGAEDYLRRIQQAMSEAGAAAPEIELRSWISLNRAVLSANEFVYVE